MTTQAPPPVIILTGASRGIGLAIATYLLTRTPARVLAIARTLAPLEALHTQYPSTFAFLAADISVPSTSARAVETAVTTWGRVDALIVNHAVLDPVSKIADANVDAWERAFQINFFSVVGLVRAAIGELRKVKGRVVFVSSGAAVTGYEGWGAYGASKAALNHFCVTLAAEEAGITCVALRPGVIDTQMQRDIREKHKEGMGAGHAQFVQLKRDGMLLRPEQPGNVTARLALSADSGLSGQFLSWDAEQLAAYQDQDIIDET